MRGVESGVGPELKALPPMTRARVLSHLAKGLSSTALQKVEIQKTMQVQWRRKDTWLRESLTHSSRLMDDGRVLVRSRTISPYQNIWNISKAQKQYHSVICT